MKIFLFFFFLAPVSVFALSEKEYIAFGLKLEESINKKNADLFKQSFDIDAFLAKTLIFSSSAKDFNKEFTRGIYQGFNLGQTIINNLGDNGIYSFLKYYRKQDEHHILFRIYTDGGGINYHDFEVKKIRRSVRIVDCYIFLSGENLSETVRRIYAASMLELSSSEMKSLQERSSEFQKTLEIRKLMEEQEFKKAQALFKDIDSVYRRQKPFQLLNIQLSSHLEEEVYVRSIKEYEALFPNDPSLNLVSIDGYFLTKKYDMALKNIDRLDHELPVKDPLLDFFRGNCYFSMEKYDSAATYYDSFNNLFPGFETVYWSLAECYFLAGKTEEALKTLDNLIERFSYSKEQINILLEENSDFTTIEMYKKWFEKKD
jgi:tetratricopeptide (TPR) repeat protein